MKITREVVYDLLPAYFANEVSADTRALVDEFLASDPEFARMTKRFQTLLQERVPTAEPQSDAARERESFDRARAAAERLTQIRGAAVAYAFASGFAFFVAFVTWNERVGYRNPGVVIGVIFLAVSVVTFVASLLSRENRAGAFTSDPADTARPRH
jgi:hypothetical protein